jgi:hypothetical protein
VKVCESLMSRLSPPFGPKQIKAATEEAARLRRAPVIIAKGVLV